MTQLDIGCGENKHSPKSIGIDVRPVRGVDIIADAMHLPIRTRSCDLLECLDILEHLVTKETPELLSEWARVLKRGGHIYIKTPDLRVLAYAYLSRQIPVQELSRKLYGQGSLTSEAWNLHKTGNDADSLREVVRNAGFVSITIEQGIGPDWSNIVCEATKP